MCRPLLVLALLWPVLTQFEFNLPTIRVPPSLTSTPVTEVSPLPTAIYNTSVANTTSIAQNRTEVSPIVSPIVSPSNLSLNLGQVFSFPQLTKIGQIKAAEPAQNWSITPLAVQPSLANGSNLSSVNASIQVKTNTTGYSTPPTTSVESSTTSVNPNFTIVNPNITGVQSNTTSVQPNTTSVQPNTTSVQPNTTSVQPNTTSVQSNNITRVQSTNVTSVQSNGSLSNPNTSGIYLPPPTATTALPNPTQGLKSAGQECLQKCRDLKGVSCKKWTGNQITCCKFTGCQWPFYCHPASLIQVDGCDNKP